MDETKSTEEVSPRHCVSVGFIRCPSPGCGSFHVPTKSTQGRVQYRKCTSCGTTFQTVKPSEPTTVK